MHHHRRRKKRPNYGSIEVSRGEHGFGFTISGQQPCILSCIVPNSPADMAGLRSGDFLISVNGLNVSKLPHESVVQLIGSADRTIRLAVAETYYSDSSDDDDLVNQVNQVHHQRVRPKFPHHKLKMNRTAHNRLSLDGKKVSNQSGEPKPSTSFAVEQNGNQSPELSCNKIASNASASAQHDFPIFDLEACRTQRSLEYRTVVGYLGTIEMPKQLIATSSKLQTVRSCIRKMRQEKRNPTMVLMTILPHCLTLKNHLNVMLAKYPNSRISFVSGNSDNDKRFFGLVTSAMYSDGVMCENGQSTDSDVIISNSCHVFVVDTKLTEHSAHQQKADEFRIACTKDPISDLCLEFPNNAEYVVNLIRSMYTLYTLQPLQNENQRPPVARQLNMNGSPRRMCGDEAAGLLVANSPQPSNHSEITTTSSNSDSGIGFHNDCANISDRILVVDFPGLQNRQIANIRGNLRQPSVLHARPVAIINDRSLLAAGNVRTPGENASPIVSLRSKSRSMDLINNSSPPADNNSRQIRAMIASNAVPGCSKYMNSPSQRQCDHDAMMNDTRSRSLHESNYHPFRERPVDVPHSLQFNNPYNLRSSQLAARSCDDVMMAFTAGGSKQKAKNATVDTQSSIDDVNLLGAAPKPPSKCKDDYVFLPPKPVRKSKKPSSYKQVKAIPSNKCSSKSVAVSPKSLRLCRRASASVENLITNRQCVRDKSDYESIWGSMQDIRRATMDSRSASTFLEGTYSEPDLTGCSTTSLCSILENMRLKYDTTIEDISVVLTVTTVLYCLGAIACGLVSKHINRQLIAIGSLMALAFGHYMAPHCPTKMIFFVVGGVLGTSLGFYDSTQLVWIIEIWQETSGPFIQTQHFCYAVGTIISPLVVAPFLNTNNSGRNETTVLPSFNTTSGEYDESRLWIPFSVLGAFISLAFAFQIFLFVFYRYRTPPMYANENFKPIDDANNIMMEMERHNRNGVDFDNRRDGYAVFGGMNVRKAKLVAVTVIFIGLYLAMEVSTMQFIQIFGQYSDLKMTQSASAYVLTALTVMFAIGRGIGIVIIFKIRPELIICLNLFLIAVANLILLVWANDNLTMFWTASILLGIGQSTTYPSFCAFMEKYLVFTSGIASLVVVVATIGGAVYPLIIGSVIEKNVIVLTYTNYFSIVVCVIVMAVGYKWTRNSQNRAR